MHAKRMILLERRAHGHQFTAPIVKERCCQPCFNPSFELPNGPDPILRRDNWRAVRDSELLAYGQSNRFTASNGLMFDEGQIDSVCLGVA